MEMKQNQTFFHLEISFLIRFISKMNDKIYGYPSFNFIP